MTIRIADELYWLAKSKAAEERVSLNEFVCRAVLQRSCAKQVKEHP